MPRVLKRCQIEKGLYLRCLRWVLLDEETEPSTGARTLLRRPARTYVCVSSEMHSHVRPSRVNRYSLSSLPKLSLIGLPAYIRLHNSSLPTIGIGIPRVPKKTTAHKVNHLRPSQTALRSFQSSLKLLGC